MIFRRSREAHAEKIINKIKAYIDILDGKIRAPSEIREVQRSIVKLVESLPLEERDYVARKVRDFINSQIDIRTNWKLEKEAEIKNQLKRIRLLRESGRSVPPERIRMIQNLDLLIKMTSRKIETMSILRDQVVEVIREKSSVDQIMKSLIVTNQAIMDFLDELSSLSQEYEEMAGESLPAIDDIERTYMGESAPKKVAKESKLDELMEEYGV